MTPLRAIFNFEVRGIWVRREALGAPFGFERNGRRIEITLPAHETDFQTYQPREGEYYNALGGGSGGTVDDPKQASA